MEHSSANKGYLAGKSSTVDLPVKSAVPRGTLCIQPNSTSAVKHSRMRQISHAPTDVPRETSCACFSPLLSFGKLGEIVGQNYCGC